MNKKIIRELPHINFEKFLREFININDETLIKSLCDLSHHEFKTICEALASISLVTISFDDLTFEDIQTGAILLITDKNSNLAPYVNPRKYDFEDLIEKNNFSRNNGQTYQEYIDELENIVSDHKTEKRKIKVLSKVKDINRKEQNYD